MYTNTSKLKNRFYSSPKCSVLEDASTKLYNNFGIREEYDPQTFTRGKDCVVYLSRTDFSEREVFMTILLIAEVTPGLSADCNVLVSSRASFVVEFCAPNDRSEACTASQGGPQGRNVPEVNSSLYVYFQLLPLQIYVGDLGKRDCDRGRGSQRI